MRLTRVQSVLVGLALLAICLVTAGLVFAYGNYNRIVVTPPPSPDINSLEPSPTLDPLRPYSILLLGWGGGGHEGGRLTDSVMVARVNPRTREIHLISIPRDVWVSFPSSSEGETHWKVNAAYAIGSDQRGYQSRPDTYKGEAGGGALARYAVGKIVGFPIDYFVSLNFAGFEKSIDVLGGVTVRVERTLDDPWYPITGLENDTCDKSPEEIEAIATLSAEQAEKEFPCRYEHLHFDPGLTQMDGETALKYARSRHGSDGGDFGRAARQRNVIAAVREKVFALNFVTKIIPFISTMAGNLETDIPLSKMQEWVAQANEFEGYTIHNVALTDQNVFRQSRSNNGQFILAPKDGIDAWESVHAYLEDQFTATESAQQP